MQQVIDAIKTGGLPDDIKEPEMLHSLGNPPKTTPPLDPTTLTSIKIFNVLALGSQQMYDGVREALSEHPTGPFQIHSYYITRQRLEKQTGISEIRTDMCPKACIAYTGPFAQLENCPECGVSRYKTEDELSESVRKKKKQNTKVPRQQFYTIPLGPQLQALWRTPQNAFFMRYRNRRTQEILALTKQNRGIVPLYEDVFDGKEYLDAYLAGQVRDDDTLVMFSWDGAQLYKDKQSDCFFGIWIVLNLSPEIRYKKKYILPALIIPGPSEPRNTESFLLPSFRHTSALQRSGLKAYDGHLSKYILTRPFTAFNGADAVALPKVSGQVGHKGALSCRVTCGMPARLRDRKYYPAALKPFNSSTTGSGHPDIDVCTLGGPDPNQYQTNLRIVLQSKTITSYNQNRRLTGIVRPSICLGFEANAMFRIPMCFPIDLMHLISINIPQHLIHIWRNTSEVRFQYTGEKPDFIVLDNERDWNRHGDLVASTHQYLPASIDRPPRNPAAKINTQYKACEYMMYLWSLGPALFRLVLPHHLWTHFCKLVCGIRLVHQRRITYQQAVRAHNILNEWEYEFELKYYARDERRLHLVRPSVHAVIHLARETIRCGPLNLLAQWALETMIGNLGEEVHQHSNPYANLSERALLRAQMNVLKAIHPEVDTDNPHPRGSLVLKHGYILLRACDRYDHNILDLNELQTLHDFLVQHDLPLISSLIRWARLRLPNGETVRCAWKELENRNTRTSRNVQIQYFFCLTIANQKRAFAMISRYSDPDQDLLEQSHQTLYVARYQGKQALEIINVYSIRLVVGMVPFMLSEEEEARTETREQFSQCYFVAENPAMLFSAADSHTSSGEEGEDEMEESFENDESRGDELEDESEGTGDSD
ncbi:hypothetical protein M378DRAFT_134374 [Amanita muscaria Koide BX008]|uniref:Uncharacterized protein n=1 Tax=Amanita muscaria (strain Koide BX008) TaxID=946122 RepID=A0A0C2RWG8_AMAMK|nr:hypothetical protein M378DRAFT_134374 [Amanita muscaria Koide BX008]